MTTLICAEAMGGMEAPEEAGSPGMTAAKQPEAEAEEAVGDIPAN